MPQPRFAAAHAAAQNEASPDWGPLAAHCLRELGDAATAATLGFLYASDAFAGKLDEILVFLRQATGIREWAGCVGLGVVAGEAEYFDRPAIAIMVADLPATAYRLLPAVESAGAVDSAVRQWAATQGTAVAVVHADPDNPRLSAVIEDIAASLPAFLVGGLTSSRGASGKVAGAAHRGGVSGVVFGPSVPLITGLTQGCSPIGQLRTVTAGEHNVIFELDGRPALDVLRTDIGDPLARRLAQGTSNIHVALPVAGSDTGDYVVRNLIGLDAQRGWIAIGDRIAAGDRLMFCRRDRAAAAEDMARMLGRLKRRLDGPPRGGLYFNCIARGPNLFEQPAEELAILRRELGVFPLVGVFCNGEISNNRLYAYTGVLVLFV